MDKQDECIELLKEANRARQALINKYVFQLIEKNEEIRQLYRYIEIIEEFNFRWRKTPIN